MQNNGSTAEQTAAALSTALEAAGAGFWEWNIQTGQLRINQQWASITGHTVEELAPMTIDHWKAQLHPEDLERATKSFEKHTAGKDGFCELAIRVRHKDGSWVSVLDRGRVQLRDANGKPRSIAGSRQAVNTSITCSAVLAESCEKELQALIENIPGTIYRIDASGATTLLSSPPPFLKNPAAEQYETALFDTLLMVHPEDRQMLADTYRKLKMAPNSIKISYRIITPQNTVQWIEDQKTSTFSDDGSFKSINGMLFDITDRIVALEETHRLESQVRKSQRLETIGTLAGGIAHDFNNILTPILGYAEMGRGSVDEADPLHEFFTEIMQAAERAQKLVSQILTFSRAQDGKPASVLIQDIIAEALKLLRPSLPSTISIKQEIDPSCRSVWADPSQIHQVIINLCTNAFHAMEHTGGALTINLKEIWPEAGSGSFKLGYNTGRDFS